MAEPESLFRRIYFFGRLLVGHGWEVAAFWIASAYSVYAVVVPTEIQARVLAAVHVDPKQRLAIWGFGLAAFFLYAGFRAWSGEREDRLSQSAVEPSKLMEQLQSLRSEFDARKLLEWQLLSMRSDKCYSPHLLDLQHRRRP